ncbi:MAG: hypothetical protein WEC00_03990, partial [Dongiaceae bacterium]
MQGRAPVIEPGKWAHRCDARRSLRVVVFLAGQSDAHLRRQILPAIGFLKQMHAAVEATVMNDRVLGVARRKQHRKRRPQRMRRIGELAAADSAGHDDIGKQQVEIVGLLQRFDRFRSVARGHHMIAEAGKLAGNMVANQIV